MTAIRAARLRAGLSGYELARLANISAPYLYDIEMGNRTPPLDTAKRIAAALNVPWDELWDIVYEKPILKARQA